MVNKAKIIGTKKISIKVALAKNEAIAIIKDVITANDKESNSTAIDLCFCNKI